MVLDRFDHHRMLKRWCGYLHSARASDPRMRNISVSADFVRGIHDDDSLGEIVRENARNLPQHRRLAHSGPTKKEDAFAGLDYITDDVACAVHGTTHPKG